MLNLGENELEKLETILKINPIEKIHLILMEVPCCQKIKLFLNPIIEAINRDIVLTQTVVGKDGSILKKEAII
jgi:hypothetical protein